MFAALRDSQKAASQFPPLVTSADCHMYKSSGNSWGSQRTLELLVPPFSKVSAFCPRGTVTSTGTLQEEFSSAAPQTPECAILSSEPGCHLVSYQCPSSLPRGEWGRSPVRGKRESSPILQISWQQQEDFTIPLCVLLLRGKPRH